MRARTAGRWSVRGLVSRTRSMVPSSGSRWPAEGRELRGDQAGGHGRDADAGRDRPDEPVDAAADAGAAERQPGAVQRAAHLGAGKARRRVHDERQRPGQVELRRGHPDPYQAVPPDELPALLAAGALADEHVEPVALQPLVQQAALIDSEVEVDQRVVPAEVPQDLRQPGQREIVGDADPEPPARPVAAEVGGRLVATRPGCCARTRSSPRRRPSATPSACPAARASGRPAAPGGGCAG